MFDFIPRHHDASQGYYTYGDCVLMNMKFARAMLAARKRGEEKFTIGAFVDTSPVEYAPRRFIGESIWSGIGSSAAMCVAECDRDEDGRQNGRVL